MMAERKQVEVAAGVIRLADGRFLLGKRAEDAVYAGYWEFPGGKVERGESPAEALARELDEELGIQVEGLWPWIVREHHYEHADVRLYFFEVPHWSGTVNDHVHSDLKWVDAGSATAVEPMLPANGPVLKALRLPSVMGITCAHQIGVAAQLARIEAALASGLSLIQVREPGMSSAELTDFVGTVSSLAAKHDALVVVNSGSAVPALPGVNGIHLRARDLMSCVRRPAFDWVGASCHDRIELERAAELGLDYALLGPVAPTPTHPGRPGLGWACFSALVAGLPMPVLALGGMRPAALAEARGAGAHGIAAIRGVWEPAS